MAATQLGQFINGTALIAVFALAARYMMVRKVSV
jgi:hypothetical protein